MPGRSLRGYKRLAGHKYRTPKGAIITEYKYRSLKAKKLGFRNYTQQRKLRESQDFKKFRFDVLSLEPDADFSVGGGVEKEVAEFLLHREDKGGGEFGSSQLIIGDPTDRFERLLQRLGVSDWWLWRFWYSEVVFG